MEQNNPISGDDRHSKSTSSWEWLSKSIDAILQLPLRLRVSQFELDMCFEKGQLDRRSCRFCHSKQVWCIFFPQIPFVIVLRWKDVKEPLSTWYGLMLYCSAPKLWKPSHSVGVHFLDLWGNPSRGNVDSFWQVVQRWTRHKLWSSIETFLC